ncbi:hypothetical protein TNCV_2056311 [Trichonephila clavipes]|nr:hypothetical protein TNCV_2056311 [Trichonephila clavipes]
MSAEPFLCGSLLEKRNMLTKFQVYRFYSSGDLLMREKKNYRRRNLEGFLDREDFPDRYWSFSKYMYARITSSSESQPPIPIISIAPTTSNILSISAASSSTVPMLTPLPVYPVLQTATNTSKTIPSTFQDAKLTLKNRKKKTPS